MDILGGILGDVMGGLGGASGAGGAGGLGSLLSGVESLFGGGSGGGLGSDSIQQGSSHSGGDSSMKDILSIAATVLPLFL